MSDTVAGAVLGYAVGDYAYRRSRAAADRSPPEFDTKRVLSPILAIQSQLNQ